jgi:hypothetical protein
MTTSTVMLFCLRFKNLSFFVVACWSNGFATQASSLMQPSHFQNPSLCPCWA